MATFLSGSRVSAATDNPNSKPYFTVISENLTGIFGSDQFVSATRIQQQQNFEPIGIARPSIRLYRNRALLWAGFSAAAIVEAFTQSQSSWGASNGKFHFKNDFTADGMAMSDEVSHLFVAYQLTNLIHSGYRWIGVESAKARRIAAAEAWLLTFLVEYPIDAYNPSQGFGISDLVFNTAGVWAAYYRAGRPSANRWDIKISVKQSYWDGDSRVIAFTDKQYDDYIYWLTVRPNQSRYAPILFGVGYSTEHTVAADVTKEIQTS